jgi:hypothetical protein
MFEAVILTLSGGMMRLAVKDAEDVLELRLVHGVWVTPDGEPVTFDFTLNIFSAIGIVPPADAESERAPALPRFTLTPVPDYLN